MWTLLTPCTESKQSSKQSDNQLQLARLMWSLIACSSLAQHKRSALALESLVLKKMLCSAHCEAAGPAVHAAHNCHASEHLLLTDKPQHYLHASADVAWWQLVSAAAAVVTARQSHRPSAVAAANATAGGRHRSHSACAAGEAAAESHGR